MERRTSVEETVSFLRNWLDGFEPQVAIMLGSGLGGLTRAVENARSVKYADIPGFPAIGVSGHAGELVAGSLEEKPVVLQSGRFHLYEGHAAETVVLPVRALAGLSVRYLIVTNAAGGINRTFNPPVLMLITDHLNMMWRNPLLGPVLEGEERFPDMSEPYSRELRSLARRVALRERIRLEEGVYCGVLGPSYETPAEVRMLEGMGADAVGMSTVPEVLAARVRGIDALGISVITNLAAGISRNSLTHEDVLRAGEAAGKDLERLVRGVVREL